MKLLFLLISVISISLGFFLFLNPALTIEIQKKFYEKINWRIEPISMQKEIRNTKIMGLFLVVITLLRRIFAILRIVTHSLVETLLVHSKILRL